MEDASIMIADINHPAGTQNETDYELIMLEQIEHDPDVTQASLAAQVGVAVGTVNWHLHRLIAKGYVKVKRAQRRKLRYIITPEGIALRARLTVNYIETSMRLYRRIRQRVRELLIDMHHGGYNSILVQGDGDIADICKLTCMEQGITILDQGLSITRNGVPVLEVQGTKISLRMED
jgi:DNA-binding MarR family transcriptional regulator